MALVQVKGYPDYQVSDSGVIYKGDKLVKCSPMDKAGKLYLVTTLKANGKYKKVYVHRIVAESFLPNPEEHPYVNHIDENKHNNCVSNLEWCTPQHNAEHSHSREVVMRSPSGERVIIGNLRKFCRESGLTHTAMVNISNGKDGYITHKGWSAWK